MLLCSLSLWVFYQGKTCGGKKKMEYKKGEKVLSLSKAISHYQNCGSFYLLDKLIPNSFMGNNRIVIVEQAIASGTLFYAKREARRS